MSRVKSGRRHAAPGRSPDRGPRSASRYVEVQLASIRLVRSERTVLRDLDWTIRPGERWILAGGNGAGKTQLLKLVSGAVWPTPTGRESRRYRWRGETWSTPAGVQDEIAYVGAERQDKYERYGWNHTVERIVGTGLYRTDIPLDALNAGEQRRVGALLARLGIAPLAARRFLTLSYGERRLVLLARALAAQPKLLLLDELLNGLDTLNRRRAMSWLERTGRSALPWVLATHRREDVPRSATHAIVLDAGRAVYAGPIGRAPLARWLESATPASRAARRQATRRRAGPAPARASSAPAARLLVGLRNASVYLDGRAVLEHLSFEVRAGDCWVVHGANGAGKTTLLRTLYGDHGVAVGGTIERAGVQPGVPLQVFKRRVGLVAPHLQTDHPQHLTVGEVVQSGRHASIGLDAPGTAAERAAARRALARFGLQSFATRTLRELSYGQLRRVLFARAWIDGPELLILDEPFAGIDAPTRSRLLGAVEAFVGEGGAVIMATHHRQEWPACATHELELAGGRSRYCGPARMGIAPASGAA